MGIAITFRDAARVKNPGGQVVMRRAAAARRRLLICQNLGGLPPPLAASLHRLTPTLEIFMSGNLFLKLLSKMFYKENI